MTREERENALHCLKVMIDEEVCEECNLYGTTGTDHCEADCVRVAIKALEQQPNRCDSCTHSEEQDGSNCYECVKGMADNFKTKQTEMRDATEEERKSVRDYIRSISKPTGVQFETQPTDADCISRQAVKDMLMEIWTRYMPMDSDVSLSFVLEKISELPSVTPQQKIGKWKYTTHHGRRYRVCIACKCEREDDLSTGWNYCPYCGAKMEEKE